MNSFKLSLLLQSAAFTVGVILLFRLVVAALRLAKQHLITDPIAEAKGETDSCRQGWLEEQKRHDATRQGWYARAKEWEDERVDKARALSALESEVETLKESFQRLADRSNEKNLQKNLLISRQGQTIADLQREKCDLQNQLAKRTKRTK